MNSRCAIARGCISIIRTRMKRRRRRSIAGSPARSSSATTRRRRSTCPRANSKSRSCCRIAAFNDDNQLVYGGGMHAQMVGFQGDHILVNGRPDYAHRRGEPRLSAADSERLELAHLQARLGRRLADHGDRRRRRPAGEAGRKALRHARARRTAGRLGRFQRAKRRLADRHAQRAVFRRIAENGARHDGRHDGGIGAAGRRRLSALYGPRRARGGRQPGLAVATRAHRPLAAGGCRQSRRSRADRDLRGADGDAAEWPPLRRQRRAAARAHPGRHASTRGDFPRSWRHGDGHGPRDGHGDDGRHGRRWA